MFGIFLKDGSGYYQHLVNIFKKCHKITGDTVLFANLWDETDYFLKMSFIIYCYTEWVKVKAEGKKEAYGLNSTWHP